jgi:small subunit ribosomal protein S6
MKIPSEKRTRSYELTCLVQTEYTQSELDEIKSKLQETIKKNGGKIKETENWGKKELAYTIKKEGKQYNEAVYLHFVFKADANQAADIKQAMNIVDEVIRYLLVKKED